MNHTNRLCITFGCILSTLAAPVRACVNPADKWAAGIVWNDSEAVDFTRLDSLHQTGIAITKSVKADTVIYGFRSHYSPDSAMVYVGYFPASFQTSLANPRMAIVADSAKVDTSFDFGAAVRVEIDWLCSPYLGVLHMTMAQRQQVQDSIWHGDCQYWTRQDRALSYNQWFTGDSIGGVWGVNGVRGGCGLDAAYDPPAQPLSMAGISDTFAITPGNVRFAVTKIHSAETHMVAAIRELGGNYCYMWMSRYPTFYGKNVCGYFEFDKILGWNMDTIQDSVFVITEILGDPSNILPGNAGRRGIAFGRRTNDTRTLFDLHGRTITISRNRPAGKWKHHPGILIQAP